MASKITLGSFMGNWGDESCVKVDDQTPTCFNLKKGFCRYGENCRFSHSPDAIPWLLKAILNLNRGVAWFNIGKKNDIPQDVYRKIIDVIGPIKRVDFVRMPGNPKKGGQFWCAVVHFLHIKEESFRTLSSGSAIHFNKGVRAQLFRSDIKSECDIRAKQAADFAAAQSLKTARATSEVLNAMNDLLKCLIQGYTC